jgi:hypothetical protein
MRINLSQATLISAWLFCLLLTPMQVAAHQQKAAITTLLFNDRTGNIEVMHRFVLHDAEHAVKVLFTKDADIYKSEKTQQAFAEYVLEHFSLYNLQDQPIRLETIGFELVGRHMWVYQETPQPQNLDGLMVTYNALQEVWSSQTNTVNIEGKGPIKTLTFTANDSVKGVEFD